jgi:hypothetical protein
MSTERTNPVGAMAAGKLLEMATGGRWGPTILILACIILLRRRAAARTARRDVQRLQADSRADTSR